MKTKLFSLIIAFTVSAFVFSPVSVKAQSTTVCKQNFDVGVDPPDSIAYGAANDDWLVDDGTQSGIPNSNGYIGASGNYFLLADDIDGSSVTETITYAVSTRAFGNLSLQWGAYSDAGFPTITLSYSTDGVTYTPVSYTQIATIDTWGLVGPVSLPAAASNATTLYLRWSYPSDGVGLYYAIDDIQLSGTVNTYFSKSSGNLNVLSNWGVNFDGTGTPPANFTTAGITYEIINNPSATIGAAWTVSGAGSKILVGDVTTTPSINFTIPSGFACTGTVSVANNGTLTIQNTTVPTLTTTLYTGSTINYAASGAQTISKSAYYNLTISGSGTKTLPNSVVTVNGALNISAGTLALANSALGVLNIDGSITGAGTITGAANAQINIAGSGALGTFSFTPGSQSVSVFKINRPGIFTCTLGSNLTVTKTFEHDNSGILDLNGHTLTVNGTSILLSTTGGATISGSSTSNLSLKASGSLTGNLYMTQTSTATSSLSSLILNSSLTLGNSLNIIDSISPTAGTLTTGGNLTLIADQSTVGHVGRIGKVGGSISGNITSQVYHNPPPGNTTNWMLMGVAGITNATFSQWNSDFTMYCPTCPSGTTPQTGGGGTAFNSVTTYNEPGDSFPTIVYSNTIVSGTGYWVYLGTTSPGTSSSAELITLTGTPKTGGGSWSGLTSSGVTADKGSNLLANPYPSPISWKKIMNDASNSGALALGASTIYVYSPTYSGGSYVTYNASGGISTPAYSPGGNSIDDKIPAGQGFYVVVNGATSINYSESDKVMSGSDSSFLFRASNPMQDASITTSYFRLSATAGANTSEAVISFNPNGTTGIDPYDSRAMTWNNVLQISTIIQGSNYVINGLPDLTTNYSIPVKILSGTTTSYTISTANLASLPSGACLTLHDTYGVMPDQDLRAGSFNVTVNDTETVARFILNITVLPLNITTNTRQASCNNTHDGLITAVGNDAGPWNYIWRNASGTVVKTSLNKTTADSLAGLNNGIYSLDVSTVGTCNSATQTFTITAPAAPTSAFTVPAQVNVGANVSFINNSTNATNYIWSFGNGDISSQQIPSYAYNNPGTYTITLDAIIASCNDTVSSTQIIQVDATTGIKQVSGSGDITLSRDGSGNYLQFDYANQTKVNITIYNILGQNLLNNAGLTVVNDRIYLNINDSKNQVLYVTITNLNNNQQTTKKFVND